MTAALTPDDFACARCRRPMKAPTADGLGPTCRRRIHGPSHRAIRAAPTPTDELTMPIPFEGGPVTKPDTMKIIISVAVERQMGSDLRDVEADVMDAVLKAQVDGAKGVLTQLVTFDEPQPDHWWSRIIRKGGFQ